MTQPDDNAPAIEEGTDITAESSPEPDPDDRPATSVAEEYREDGETLGGTGGLDAGGAG